MGVFMEHVAPAAGAVLAFFLFLAPMKDVRKATRTRDLGGLNPLPFVLILSNCLAWIAYGVALEDWYVFAANWPGLCMGTYYMLSLMDIASRQQRQRIRGVMVFSLVVITGIQMGATLLDDGDEDARKLLFGCTSIFFLLLFWTMPLTELRNIVRGKDASPI
ncbi:MAG: hypothetical protein MHM6MM_009359, partial [Cercozoa sp. M6MM]